MQTLAASSYHKFSRLRCYKMMPFATKHETFGFRVYSSLCGINKSLNIHYMSLSVLLCEYVTLIARSRNTKPYAIKHLVAHTAIR